MRTRRGRGAVVGVVAIALASVAIALASVAVAVAMAMSTAGGARSEATSAPRRTATAAVHAATAKNVSPAIVAAVTPVTPTTTPTTQAVAIPTTTPTTQAAVPAPAPAAVTPDPAIATMVAQVEASGIDPGSNWSWSIGDTATHCTAMSGAGTGCTYGTGGQEFTIFAGSPNLTLVAHELANAETQNDAVPTLMNEVATAEGGTSWSPTDAVASCLVEHFMGFEDDAAGTWQCSAALGVEVAAHIHDGA